MIIIKENAIYEVNKKIAALGLNQKKVSKIIGVSPIHLGNILRGDSTPSPELALNISKYFNMEWNDLWIFLYGYTVPTILTIYTNDKGKLYELVEKYINQINRIDKMKFKLDKRD